MNCDDVRSLLEGGLPAVESSPGGRQHLETCAACREYVAGMKSEDELLAGALRAPAADDEGFARVKAGLRRKLNGRGPKRPVPPPRHAFVSRPWVLAAAGLLLALTAYLVIAWAKPAQDPGRLAQKHPEPVRSEPKVPPPAPEKGVQPGTLATQPAKPATWTAPKDVAELQSRLRGLHLLDDLNQVQVVMRSMNDTEGLGVAEDAELYIERIFALNPNDSELCRDVLTGIHEAGMTERLRGLKERWRAPEAERVLHTLEASDWALGPALQPALVALKPSISEEATFAEAEKVFRKRDYNRALNLYRSFAEDRPKDRRAPLAEHASAFILQKKLKEPAEARKTYQRMTKNHAQEPIAQMAYFHIAETFEDDGRVDNALEQYGGLLDMAPKHPRANEATRRSEALRRKQKGEEADPTWSQVLLQKKKKTPRSTEPVPEVQPTNPGESGK